MRGVSGCGGAGDVSHRVRLAVGLLLLALLTVPATAAPEVEVAQQLPEPPFYALLPHDYPYPLIRVCSTPQGICAVPVSVVPGQPCQCRRPDGIWVQGVCVH